MKTPSPANSPRRRRIVAMSSTIGLLLPLILLLPLLSSSFEIRTLAASTNISSSSNNNNDTYTPSDPSHSSLLVALGCFWCAEQAFEQYAPGVVEVISGYAGAEGNDNPTYRNHPGHYEVILIEYDSTKTSYKLLVEYAFRNLDPFDGEGQFCDKGFSYRPAIFYANEAERMDAEQVLADVLAQYPKWNPETIKVAILERPTFWTAEDYHQDYYIKNPRNYGFYKNGCRRTQTLKSVWGEEEYKCYHDLNSTCFSTVSNAAGVQVRAEINIKGAGQETAKALPTWGVVILSVAVVFTVAVAALTVYCRCFRNSSKS